MQKFLFLFLCAMIAWFQFQAKFGRGGYIDDNIITTQINKQLQINHDLAERNNQMILQISGLKGSSDSIEARSRSELNMIKKGETLVMLPGNDIVVDNKK